MCRRRFTRPIAQRRAAPGVGPGLFRGLLLGLFLGAERQTAAAKAAAISTRGPLTSVAESALVNVS
jgi:hypothetical protein